MLTDPNTPPDTPEIKPQSPEVKPTEPASQEPQPTAEETAKGNKLLQNLLGLVKPEEKDVKPKEEPPAAPPVSGESTPAPAPVKKVAVKPRPVAPAPTPQPPVQEIVDTAVKTAIAATAPKQVDALPAPKDEDLSPDEREELALAEYAEKKDPSKKGLSDQFRAFYKAQKDFLTKAVAEDPDYDPDQDPKFKQFLAKHEPKLPSHERKKLITDQIAERAAEEGYKKARQELLPEVEQTKRKLREMEERPKVQKRLETFVDEVATGMPEEIVKFYEANGRDVAKVQEAFPVEFEIISGLVSSAAKLGDEFLSVRRGIKDFDPVTNPDHKFLDGFVREQGALFMAKAPRQALVRDGKQFIPPHQWKAGMEKTHWTFGDEDVLHMLKVQAQNAAKQRISEEQARVERVLAAKQKRAAVPPGATPPAEPKIDTPVSPKVTPAPVSSGEAPPSSPESGILQRLLFQS